MTNEKIAKILSKHCLKPNLNERDFAIQSFVEKSVLPEKVQNYTEETLEKYILEHLNTK